MRNILLSLLAAFLLIFSVDVSAQTPGELPGIGAPAKLGRYLGGFAVDSNFILPGRNAKRWFNYPGRMWFNRYTDSNVYAFDGVREFQILSTKDSARVAGWAAAGVDGQTLSISNDSISISNGNTIVLPNYAYSSEIADSAAAVRSDLSDAIADSVALRVLNSRVVTSIVTPNGVDIPTTGAVNGLVSSYLLKSDTAAMLLPYVLSWKFLDSIAAMRALANSRLKYTDTANMLLPYLLTPDTTGNTGKVLTKGASSIYWGALSVVGSLQSSNSSLSISPPTGAVDALLNTAHSNSWSVPQDFTKITIDTLQAHTSAGGAIRTNSGAACISWGAGGGQNVTLAGYPITNSGDSVLTTNSSGGLLRYDLKGNYKRIADSTGAVGYTTIGSRDKAKDSAIAYTGTAITADRTATATLTNKRIEYRTQTVASFTTSVAVNADLYDRIVDTAQSGSLLLALPTGTHFEGQELIFTITAATGTISITYNGVFVPSTQIPVLPAATLATTYRTIKLKFIWNNRTQKWFLVAKDTW